MREWDGIHVFIAFIWGTVAGMGLVYFLPDIANLIGG